MNLVSQNKAGNKTKVTLSISEEARLKAKKMGLNMSAILENTLIHGLFPVGESAFEINAAKTWEYPTKTELISVNNEVLNAVECARSSFTPYDTESAEWLILPVSLVYSLVNSDFSTITKSKRELLISVLEHSHLIRGSLKNNNIMFMERMNAIMNDSVDISYINEFFKEPKNESMPKLQKVTYTNCIEKTTYINDLFSVHKQDFIMWARDTIKTDKRLNECVKYLESFSTIARPSDILNFESRNGKKFDGHRAAALKKLFSYLEEMNNTDEEVKINGCSLELFRKKIRAVEAKQKVNQKKTPSQLKTEQTTKDAKNLTVEDIKEACARIPDELKPFFKIMIYSGMRAAQLFRLLSSKEKTIENKGDFIKVTAPDVQLGNKKQFISMYAPVETLSYISKFNPKTFRTADKKRVYTYDNLIDKFKMDLSSGRRITAKGLRKFNLNFLVNDCGIEGRLADYLQSRTDGSIRAKHYENLEMPTDAAYEKIVSMFLELLPF